MAKKDDPVILRSSAFSRKYQPRRGGPRVQVYLPFAADPLLHQALMCSGIRGVQPLPESPSALVEEHEQEEGLHVFSSSRAASSAARGSGSRSGRESALSLTGVGDLHVMQETPDHLARRRRLWEDQEGPGQCPFTPVHMVGFLSFGAFPQTHSAHGGTAKEREWKEEKEKEGGRERQRERHSVMHSLSRAVSSPRLALRQAHTPTHGQALLSFCLKKEPSLLLFPKKSHLYLSCSLVLSCSLCLGGPFPLSLSLTILFHLMGLHLPLCIGRRNPQQQSRLPEW